MIVVKKKRSPSIVEHLDNDTLRMVGENLTHGRTTHGAVRLACILGRTCATFRAITNSVLQAILQLDEDQLKVFQAAMKGESILITGVAGTGKSQIVRAIRSVSSPDRMAVTASTGAAAAMVGGSTINSFLGMGTGRENVEVYFSIVYGLRNKELKERIVSTDRILIDEISMIDSKFFDKIYSLVNGVRRWRRWSPVQFILVGDFLQLPAVSATTNGFVFQSKAWKELGVKVFELKKVHRQTDPKLLEVLGRIRGGNLSQMDHAYLMENCAKEPHEDSVCLFAKNDDADTHNRVVLSKIHQPTHPFNCVDKGDEHALTAVTAQPKLFLKVGALVMCLKNINVSASRGRLVNGSVGRVQKVDVVEAPPMIRNAHITVEFTDYGYTGDTPHKFTHTFITGCTTENEFSVYKKDKVVATRYQIPLKLAWGVSIHKSQGATFDKLVVNMEGCFADGQAYVALSRARTLAGMHITGLTRRCVRASAVALDFYKRSSLI